MLVGPAPDAARRQLGVRAVVRAGGLGRRSASGTFKIYGIRHHMHLLGRAMTTEVVHANGSSTTIHTSDTWDPFAPLAVRWFDAPISCGRPTRSWRGASTILRASVSRPRSARACGPPRCASRTCSSARRAGFSSCWHIARECAESDTCRGVCNRMGRASRRRPRSAAGSTKLATLGTFDAPVEAAVARAPPAQAPDVRPVRPEGPGRHGGGGAARSPFSGDDDEEVDDGEEASMRACKVSWTQADAQLGRRGGAAPLRACDGGDGHACCGCALSSTHLRARRIQALHLRAAGWASDETSRRRARGTADWKGRPAGIDKSFLVVDLVALPPLRARSMARRR